MVYRFFDKKSKDTVDTRTWNPENIQLTNSLHKPIIRKFKRPKVPSSFWDNTWGADLADIQLIIKCNKEVRFLLCNFLYLQ